MNSWKSWELKDKGRGLKVIRSLSETFTHSTSRTTLLLILRFDSDFPVTPAIEKWKADVIVGILDNIPIQASTLMEYELNMPQNK
jgi:hypothetical protein